MAPAAPLGYTIKPMLEPIVEALRGFLGRVPAASAPPGADPRALTRTAALKAAALSGTLALPPGPVGALTVLPDLLGVWRIQSQLVVDLAARYGQSVRVTRESLLFCLFKHGGAQALRDIAARIAQRSASKAAARWLPVVGALGVGAYAYYDTLQVGRTAMDFFRENAA